MKLSDSIAFLALVTSLFSTLFSIWVQNKGISKQLQVANISEYTKRYQEIFKKFPKTILEEKFNLDSLPSKEKEDLLRLMWLYFDLCYEEYMLYKDLNLINKKLWNMWEISMTSAFARPAFYQGWSFILRNSFYPDDFNTFVNLKMSSLHIKSRNF